MELFPAIDLHDGGAVRLVQGDFGRVRGYGDPVALARSYAFGGARWIHVVDLDAARTGSPANRAVIRTIVERAGVPVQVGGGVRTEDDVAELVGFGATRVVMGTTALREHEVALSSAKRFPGRLALGLDYRRRPDGVFEAAASGWREASGSAVSDVLARFAEAPLGAVVVTAIERDGTGTGPDLDGLVEVLDDCEHPVIASGGVASVRDLEALCALRSPLRDRAPAGVVVGMALLDGSMGVAEAVSACAPSA
jgi:phosphoribosylformimino-5-aminoimidazole carboxamide ribotide isomerase